MCTAASKRRWPIGWMSRATSRSRSTSGPAGEVTAAKLRGRDAVGARQAWPTAWSKARRQLAVDGHRGRGHGRASLFLSRPETSQFAVKVGGRARARAGARRPQAEAADTRRPLYGQGAGRRGQRARPKASLTLLTVAAQEPRGHAPPPRSAKVLYLLKGHARLLGPPGAAPEKLDEGDGDLRAAGVPARHREHGPVGTGGRVPAGLRPRGPSGSTAIRPMPGRADFEVIRDPGESAPLAGARRRGKPVLATLARAEAMPLPAGPRAGRDRCSTRRVTGTRRRSAWSRPRPAPRSRATATDGGRVPLRSAGKAAS